MCAASQHRAQHTADARPAMGVLLLVEGACCLGLGNLSEQKAGSCLNQALLAGEIVDQRSQSPELRAAECLAGRRGRESQLKEGGECG